MADNGPDGKPFRPDNWGEYRGGVAIVLQNLDPPLTPGQITDRINRQQLQAAADQAAAAAISFRGRVALWRQPTPPSLAIVLSKNPNLLYEKDPKQWDELFAGPLWKSVVEGVDRPAQLKEVRNFDAQVAGDAQTNALLALSLSILVIMAYIWIRFGNLKYGTATMVALLHDTLFTIAALGFAHYLVDVPVAAADLPARAVPRKPDRRRGHPHDHGLLDDRHDRGIRPNSREPRQVWTREPSGDQ